MTESMHKFKICDAQAKQEFEKLFGFTIHGQYIWMLHKTYVKNAAVIQAIQMASAFRLKREGG